MYDTQTFASSRLNETVVLYDGKPHFVLGVGSDMTLSTHVLPGQKQHGKIPITDPRLNVSKFELGYMNQSLRGFSPITGYYTRMPARKTKQGLSWENTSFIPLSGDRKPAKKFQFSWAEFIGTQGFVDSLSGMFPSKKTALSRLSEGTHTGQAFSRCFAFEMSTIGLVILHYKGNAIAYSEDGDLFLAKKKYHYLREVMGDSGLKLGLKEAWPR
jgi:hypothetical protein